MKILLSRFAELNCGWNIRALDERDLFRLCKRFELVVIELPQQTSGFYFSMNGRHFITVSSALRGQRRLFVLFHEFAHFYLHAPQSGYAARFHGVGYKTRSETEADLFASCAILPYPTITQNLGEVILEEFGIPEDILAQRLAILERYGI